MTTVSGFGQAAFPHISESAERAKAVFSYRSRWPTAGGMCTDSVRTAHIETTRSTNRRAASHIPGYSHRQTDLCITGLVGLRQRWRQGTTGSIRASLCSTWVLFSLKPFTRQHLCQGRRQAVRTNYTQQWSSAPSPPPSTAWRSLWTQTPVS